MSRVLAVEWDTTQVRGLIASEAGGALHVEAMFVEEVAPTEAERPTAKSIGAALAKGLADKRIAKTRLLVGAGRHLVEFRQLSLPPSPADDLPDMVRLQAEQELTALDERDSLDFCLLSGDEKHPVRVLAAAMPAGEIAEIREICRHIGQEPQRIVLRAGATAGLLLEAAPPEPLLCLDVSPQEMDLMIFAAGQIALLRTVRLSNEQLEKSTRNATIVNEVRRTLAAAGNQPDVQSISAIRLFALPEESPSTSELLQQRFGLPVEVVDPFTKVVTEPTISDDMLATRGRFGALVGMAHEELLGHTPAFDFLNPKRRAKPPSQSRTWALAGAAAVLLIVSTGWLILGSLSEPLRRQGELRAELESLEPLAQRWAAVEAQSAAIENWLSTDVNWLEQLDDLSRNLRAKPLSADDFPVNDDVVVTHLRLSRSNDEGGVITLEAVARRAAAVPDIERRLRQSGHQVELLGGQEDGRLVGYRWSFNETIRVEPDDPPSQQELSTP